VGHRTGKRLTPNETFSLGSCIDYDFQSPWWVQKMPIGQAVESNDKKVYKILFWLIVRQWHPVLSVSNLMNPKSLLKSAALITIKKGEARLLKVMTTNLYVNPDKTHKA